MTSSSNWAMGKCPYCDMPTEECDCDSMDKLIDDAEDEDGL